MDAAACEFPSSQYSQTPISRHEVSFNLNRMPPIFKDEDNSINLDSSPLSPKEASSSHMKPSSLNGLLHCMPSFYEDG